MTYAICKFLIFVCCWPAMFAVGGVMLCKWLTVGSQPRLSSARLMAPLIIAATLMVCSVCGFFSLF